MEMERLEHPRHPYLLTLFGFVLLGVIGGIVWMRLPSAQTGYPTSGWETLSMARGYPAAPRDTSPTSDASFDAQTTPDTVDTSAFVTGADGSTYLIEPAGPVSGGSSNPSAAAGQVIKTDSAFDFEDFMQQLRHTPTPTAAHTNSAQTPTNTDIGSVYALLPPELLTPIQTNAANRSALQEALYIYGNTTGQFIKTYEQMHPKDAETLQRFFDDQTAAHAADIVSLGKDIAAIGTGLKTVTNIPEKAASAHQTLAESYITLGTRLEAVSKAKTDEDLVKLLEPYNAALEPYIKSYVELVTLFSGNGVSFKDTDGGSVFMFQTLGL